MPRLLYVASYTCCWLIVSQGFSADPKLTSHLIAENPAITRVNEEMKELILKRLKTHKMPNVHGALESRKDWYLHRGDLVVDRSLHHDRTLVVFGSMTVQGTFDDEQSPYGLLLVFGDMRVEHLLSIGTLAVTGNIKADGLIYPYYNDFTFEVGKSIEAKALCISDKSHDYDKTLVKAEVHASPYSLSNEDWIGEYWKAVRLFVPAVYADNLIDEGSFDHDEDDPFPPLPSVDACRELILRGEPLFRQTPAPKSLRKSVIAALRSSATEEELRKMISVDPVLAMLIASGDGLSPALQDDLIATKNEAVFSHLSSNPSLGPERMLRLAELSDKAAAIIAARPDAPTQLTKEQGLVLSSNPEVRLALIEQETLTANVIRALAIDSDSSVRSALVWSHHAHYLPQEIIAKITLDANSELRSASIPLAAAMKMDRQLNALSRDSDQGVQESLANYLVQEALWQRPRHLTDQHRIELATLLAKSTPEAVPAMAPNEQLRIGRKCLKDFADKARGDLANSRTKYRLKKLSRETTSDLLLEELISSADIEVMTSVASNLSLPPKLQMQLTKKLRPSNARLRFDPTSVEGIKAMHDALSKPSTDSIAQALALNPNASPEALLELARYALKSKGYDPVIIPALLQRDHQPAELLAVLRKANHELNREDWSLSVITSRHATRKLLALAIPEWYEGEAATFEFQRISRLPSVKFWHAMATAKSPALRGIAAISPETPLIDLARIADSEPDEDARVGAFSNPKLPNLEKYTSDVTYHYAVARNPAVSGQTLIKMYRLALRTGKNEEFIGELLSARKLKATE